VLAQAARHNDSRTAADLTAVQCTSPAAV